MRKRIEKAAQRIDVICRNWWHIGLAFLMFCIGVVIILFAVKYTGVGIHSNHLDVNPYGTVKTK